MSQKINQILNENNIITIDDLKFKNNQKEILFLNNIKIIINNQININIINNDIKDIILNINPNKETIQKIKSINWNNLEKIISNKDKTKTNQRIYQDIIKLIKEELITEIKEETEKNRQIIEEKNKEKAKKFNLNIKFNYQETGKKTTTNDFILYFNQKLQHFAKYISPNLEDKEITRISNLEEIYNSNNQVTIIGLISNLKYTKNGHLIITLEDRSGQIECFLNKNKFLP